MARADHIAVPISDVKFQGTPIRGNDLSILEFDFEEHQFKLKVLQYYYRLLHPLP